MAPFGKIICRKFILMVFQLDEIGQSEWIQWSRYRRHIKRKDRWSCHIQLYIKLGAEIVASNPRAWGGSWRVLPRTFHLCDRLENVSPKRSSFDELCTKWRVNTYEALIVGPTTIYLCGREREITKFHHVNSFDSILRTYSKTISCLSCLREVYLWKLNVKYLFGREIEIESQYGAFC